MNSNLTNKSQILEASADLLHNKNYYPAVAHCAYYGCVQLMKHIWLYKMKKSEDELDIQRKNEGKGLHEFLLNQVVAYIKNISKNSTDHRVNNDILQLKKIRVKADYKDEGIDSTDSLNAINLSKIILPVLKQYI